jgi:hypothetical protein
MTESGTCPARMCLELATDARRVLGDAGNESAEIRAALGTARDVMAKTGLVCRLGCLSRRAACQQAPYDNRYEN